jgi:hypothetical protein
MQEDRAYGERGRGGNYQELVDTLGHKPLRTSDRDFIARLFGAWEYDFAVPCSLQFLDLRQPREQLTVIKTVDADDLGGELGVLRVYRLAVETREKEAESLTCRSTISRISVFTSSRLWALRAGVRQMTLSTRLSSSSRPIPPFAQLARGRH